MTTSTSTYNTGGTFTFTAPSTLINGAVSVDVRGAAGASNTGSTGGSGGQVTGSVPLSAGGSLTVVVASGRTGNLNGGTGGAASPGGNDTAGGVGGGSSAIKSGSTTLVDAGGGGGAGGADLGESWWGGNGGSGGNGGAGANGSGSNTWGHGGSGGTGGAGGGNANPGYNGSAGANQSGGTGGNGGNGNQTGGWCGGGGGGGGGYYSGGGGGGGGADGGAGGSGGGGAGGFNYAAASVSNVGSHYAVNSSTTGYVTITYTTADAPNAPTLTSPTNGASGVNNANQSTTLSWTYNPGTNSGSQNAYSLRIKLGAGAYQYWNASTGALQGTQVWNSSSSTSVSLPKQTLQGGGSYSWSVATQESYYNLQGPFQTDSTFTTQSTLPTGFSVTGDQFQFSTITPKTTINSAFAVNDSISLTFASSQPNWSPGVLNSVGIALPTSVISQPYLSYHNVIGIQFATIQSDAVQLIPNDHMLSGLTNWTAVGPGAMTYDSSTNSIVINQAQNTSLPVVGGHSLIRPPVAPVLAEQATTVAGSYSGLISQAVTPSANGQLYAAVKFTPLTSLHNPLILQLVTGGSTVVQSWTINGYPNQQQVQVFPFAVGEFAPSGTPLQLQLVQAVSGSAGDVWSVQAISLFDEGLFWQFAVDGGFNYQPALGIRNNPYGYLQFPAPGNQLVWKVTFYQPNMTLNELEIRPIYAGSPFLDQAIGRRGSTVEFTDNFIQITTDPLFNQKQVPIPRSWYTASSSTSSTTGF